MAADLGLVADTTEGNTNKLAAHGSCNRLTEAGLADPGRTDEGDDRPVPAGGSFAVGIDASVEAALVAKLARGEELDDAILHIVEAVVISVEHRLRVVEIDVVVTALAPRHLEDAVEPGADP